MKYPDFPSAMRPVPQSAELFVSKLFHIFSDDKSNSDEDREQQRKGTMLTRFRHLKPVVPNLNHIYENKGTLTTWSKI
jgi:hypothetical protein